MLIHLICEYIGCYKILPLFLNIYLFRDFKWTTTYGCIYRHIIKECCTTSVCHCCLASNINLVLFGTYVIGKDLHFDPFCVWGNEISMNQHQVMKLIKTVSKMGPKMAIKLFVYALSKTTTNCRMVSKNSAALFLLPTMSCVR